MKILLVSQYFWPESFRINDWVAACRDLGHDVTVLTAMPNYPSGRLFPGYTWRGPYRQQHDGAAVRRVPIVTRGSRRGWRLALNYFSFVVAGVVWGPWLVPGRPDVIVVYAPSPIMSAIPGVWLRWRRRAPLALWVQDLWPDNLAATGAVRSLRLLGAFEALSRWIYRRTDLILAQSDAFVAPIQQVLRGTARPVRVLPNWADDFYRPLEIEADAPERREFPQGFTVVFAGNLGSAQGLASVLDAAEVLRGDDVHWVFIGDGNQRESLEAEVGRRGLGDRVRFLGRRAPESMPRYLSLADALLVSLRRDPAFALTVPAKVQSSLAMGRPVLAALEGEGARIVRDAGAGVVVEPENGGALAAGVRALLAAGAEGRAAMGARGRAYAAAHFDRDALVQRLDGWLKALKEERP